MTYRLFGKLSAAFRGRGEYSRLSPRFRPVEPWESAEGRAVRERAAAIARRVGAESTDPRDKVLAERIAAAIEAG